ncbi:MAG: YtxH domain-containing protein [Byssovorax sp.]
MATMLGDTMATAKNLLGTAKEGTEHAAGAARSTVMDGVHAITNVAAMLRSLGADDALGWVGLSRRRSPLVSMAIFGAGFAAGAGAGLLLAPASGADLRRNLMKSLMGLWGKVEDVADKAETKVEKVEDQAEEMAGKAKDAVKKAERKVEDTVKTGAASVVSAVKDTLHDPKSMVSPASDPAHETAKAARSTTGHRAS